MRVWCSVISKWKKKIEELGHNDRLKIQVDPDKIKSTLALKSFWLLSPFKYLILSNH